MENTRKWLSFEIQINNAAEKHKTKALEQICTQKSFWIHHSSRLSRFMDGWSLIKVCSRQSSSWSCRIIALATLVCLACAFKTWNLGIYLSDLPIPQKPVKLLKGNKFFLGIHRGSENPDCVVSKYFCWCLSDGKFTLTQNFAGIDLETFSAALSTLPRQ